MNHKNFTAINTLECGTLDYVSILDLLKDQDKVQEIRERELVQFHRGSMLAYYVNNVLSVDGGPMRIGSFSCDISYWVSQKTESDYSDIIGYIVDELRFYDYVVNGALCDEDDTSGLTREELFIHRLSHWFDGCNRKGELPRSRRII